MGKILLSCFECWFDLTVWFISPIDRVLGWAWKSDNKPLAWLFRYLYKFLFLILGCKVALSVLCHFKSDMEQA